MLTEFDEWLSRRVTTERKAVITDAMELLAMLSDHRVDDIAINAMSLSERLDTNTVVSTIAVDLREYSLTIPLEYGVSINSERFEYSDQATVNKILLTLTQVDAWEDVTRILELAQLEDSSEEVFAALCEEITAVEAEEVLPLLESVSPDMIQKIIDLCKTKLGYQLEAEVQPLWQKDVYRINDLFNIGGAGISNYLRSEGTLGLEFKQYVELFVTSFFTDKDLDYQAKNWILMSLASGTVEKDLIYTQCIAMFDETYSSLELQSKIAKNVKVLLDKVFP